MANFVTPGIYFERRITRTALSLPRTDIAGFVGVAQRGPLHTPIRLSDWREFQQVFGGFLPYAALAYAVFAFFENGGRVCWVVRAADKDAARAASVTVPQQRDAANPSLASLRVSAVDPGTWGDRLEVALQPGRRLQTQHIALGGLAPFQLAVRSLVGISVGSRLRLWQEPAGGVDSITRTVVSVNVLTGVLTLSDTIAPLRAMPNNVPPIQLECLEMTLLVIQDNQVLERFSDLGFESAHPRYAPDVVNNQSHQVRLWPADGFPPPLLPWRGGLKGGLNGLNTMDVFDYAGDPATEGDGLAALARVDEVSILAIPDLVMRALMPEPRQRVRRPGIDPCALDAPRMKFVVKGTVTDAETLRPLAGVTVEVDAGLGDSLTTKTALDGSYQIGNPDQISRNVTDLLPFNLNLTIRGGDGYDVLTEELIRPAVNTDFSAALRPFDLPPLFSNDDIFSVQSAMITQCERLRDRFAILDAPQNKVRQQPDLSEIIAWRSRFDSEFAALYFPWLIVRDPAIATPYTSRYVPPSGHMAGVYAATDLEKGVFRAPANRPLVFVDDVATALDDAAQGVLNPLGINAVRALAGRGIRPFGARTLAGRGVSFVNVRRFLNQLVEAMQEGLQWAVHEPIGADLETSLRLWITSLLDDQWRKGALVGPSADAAYQVRCDASTTLEDDRANGRIVVEVGVAPTVPYEFILLRMGFTLDELVISEV